MKQKEETFLPQAVIVSGLLEESEPYLSQDNPVGLYHVVDAPVLEYLFSFLELNGIEETLVFCTEDNSKIKAFVDKRKTKEKKMSIIVLKTEQKRCCTIGDVFRELDRRCLINDVFVLFYETHVCFFDLHSVLKTHYERRKTDKNIIATFLLKRLIFPDKGEEVFVLNSKEDTILYQSRLKKNNFSVPELVLKQERDFVVSNNLFDTGVLVGTPEMLALFTDNFDHFSIKSFLFEVLTSSIVSYKIASSIIEKTQQGYVQQVKSPFLFQKVSLDIISRRLSPFSPVFMANFFAGRNYVYTKNKSFFTGDAKDCSIGKNVSIEENTRIRSSVIGNGCVIKKNVSMQNVFLFDNVFIREGVCLKNCIVESYVVIEKSNEMCFCSYSNERIICTERHEEDSVSGDGSETDSQKECDLHVMTLDIIENNWDIENAILELGSLRLALNETNECCLDAVVNSILSSNCFQENKTALQFRAMVSKWNLLIKRFVEKETSHTILSIFMDICVFRKDLSEFFGHFVIVLYEEDVLEDDTIVNWYKEACVNADEHKFVILKQIEHFISYLEEND